jgi:acyl carrier protein
VIFAAIDEINQQLPKEQQLSKSLNTVLFDGMGSLDSLGFINFIVVIEQKVESEFKETVLMDGIKISKKDNPFRSVNAFADYIYLRLKREK